MRNESRPATRVLCYGILGIDHIYRITSFPERDGHARILQEVESLGGEAANTAVNLACLGLPVDLQGNVLGDDLRGRQFRELIGNYPVVSGGIETDPTATTFYAVILADAEGGRTIMGFSGDLRSVPLLPENVDGCALLSVDPFLGENGIQAAQMARDRGIPVVSIELEGHHPLAPLCDLVINSSGFIRRHELGTPETVAESVLASGAGLVVVTRGEAGATAFLPDGNRMEQPALPAAVVDTTGAGDAFRAGMIYGMLQDWSLAERLRVGAAMGAIACEKMGGCGNLPGVARILRRMRKT